MSQLQTHAGSSSGSGSSYSNLFHSGLRAITSPRSARARPVSMIQMAPAFSDSQTVTSKHTRRPSITSLFTKRKDAVAEPEPETLQSPSSALDHEFWCATTLYGRQRVLEGQDIEEVPESWDSDGGYFFSDGSGSSADDDSVIKSTFMESYEAFPSSPIATPFMLGLNDSAVHLSPERRKNESFLSFSTNSNTDSSVYRLPRRERPTSVHTMPLPSSRSSAYLSMDTQEKSWILEEPSPKIRARTVGEAEVDRPASPLEDWRQFHSEWLKDGSPFQHAREF